MISDLLKLTNPAYWYLLAAKLGARLLLMLTGAVIVAFIALDAGAVSMPSLGASDMLKAFFGW